jgi:hypothetical protein
MEEIMHSILRTLAAVLIALGIVKLAFGFYDMWKEEHNGN